MGEKNMSYILKNWSLRSLSGGQKELSFMVCGRVYGRPGWGDGSKLCSTEIQEVTIENDEVIITTKNSVYCCPMSEHHCPVEDIELQQRFFDEASRGKIETASACRYEQNIQALATKLPAEEKEAILFVVSSQADYCFEGLLLKNGKDIRFISDYHVHTGMIQNSVLIGDMESIDFRFFPYYGNKISFYVWRTTCRTVYVYNLGPEPVRFECLAGDYLIPPGMVEKLIIDCPPKGANEESII